MRKKLLLCLLALLYILPTAAREDKELDKLRENAEWSKKHEDCFALCTYLIEHNATTDEFLFYLDEGYRDVKKRNDGTGLANYHSLKADYYLLIGDGSKFMLHKKAALARYEALHLTTDAVDCLGQMGYYYLMAQQPDSSRYYTRRGIALLPSTSHEYYPALLHNVATSFADEGVPDSALYYSQKAQEAAIQLKDTSTRIDSYIQMGVLYRKKNRLPEALECYESALRLAEHFTEYSGISVLYGNMAILYNNNAVRTDEAIEMADKAVQAALEENDPPLTANAYIIKSALHRKKEQYRQSLDAARQALSYFDKEEYPRFFLKTTACLIPSYLALGQTDSARVYQTEADKYIRRVPANSNEAKDYYLTRMKIGNATGQYEGALAVADSLLKIVSRFPDLSAMPGFYQSQAEAYQGLGHHKQAYEAMKLATAYRDSVFSKERSGFVTDFMVKYKTLDKELEIARLQKKELSQKAQKLQYTISFVSMVALLLLAFGFVLYKHRRQKQEAELRLSRKYVEGIDSFCSRMAHELHDGVCNDLLALEWRLKGINPPVEQGVLSDPIATLSEIQQHVRRISHGLAAPAFQYADINEVLTDFITHLHLPFQLTYSSTEGADWSRVSTEKGHEIYRIVQESISNIIKHAQATKATVSLAMINKTLTLAIADNGHGFDVESAGKGLGLRTIQERVTGMGGTLHIQSSPEGTTVTVQTGI